MSWWTSAFDVLSTAGKLVSDFAQWTWSKVPFNRALGGALSYGANTTAQLGKQVYAVPSSLSTLYYEPSSRKIFNGMVHIVVHDISPIIGVNYVNHLVQDYVRPEVERQVINWLVPHTGVLAVFSIADYAVKIYTFRQGIQTLVHTTLLDTIAPSAFNEHKAQETPNTICKTEQCNVQRFSKGYLREPIILMTNDFVSKSMAYLPYIGQPLSLVLNTFFMGRYITRVATPERCERHKLMVQESVLALGMSFQLQRYLMDLILESTVGMPPYLFYRTMQHLLLLMNINNASHMNLPLNGTNQTSVAFDALNLNEAIIRFISDVIFSGLLKRIPLDFKMDEEGPPLISMSTALQFGTKVLKKDLEKEVKDVPTLYSQGIGWARTLFFPELTHSMSDLVNDPIIGQYWPDIQSGAIKSLKLVLKAKDNRAVITLAWAPKGVAAAVKLFTGIPKKITESTLLLAKEQDFWDFIGALKYWFERHGPYQEPTIVLTPEIVRLSEGLDVGSDAPVSTPIIPLPVCSPEEMKVEVPVKVVVAGEELAPVGTSITKIEKAVDRNLLFATTPKKRNEQQSVPRGMVITDNYF